MRIVYLPYLINTMVKAKKYLGQHFLKSEEIAQQTAAVFKENINIQNILEVGPGTGMLSKHILATYPNAKLKVMEVDEESIAFLQKNYPDLEVIEDDFIQSNLKEVFLEEFMVLGNFPYNISTKIILKILQNKNDIPYMAGMFQKEMAEKICSLPNSKSYGVVSVLAQAFYDVEYLFTVPNHVFDPPPKVESAVIKMVRKKGGIDCSEKLFFQLVKKSFNLRRKMLRGSLKADFEKSDLAMPIFSKRPENLTVEDFVYLCKLKK